MRFMDMTTFELYDFLKSELIALNDLKLNGAYKYTIESQKNRIRAIIYCIRKKRQDLF